MKREQGKNSFQKLLGFDLSKTIELFKENMKFSIAHFTIFSETERENLHGHNYNLKFSLELKDLVNGMAFNYRCIKKKIREICDSLDEKLIIPERSPFLKISKDGGEVFIEFNKTKMIFQKRDILILPIVNTTLECFGEYILQKLCDRSMEEVFNKVSKLSLVINSGPGQQFTTKILF